MSPHYLIHVHAVVVVPSLIVRLYVWCPAQRSSCLVFVCSSRGRSTAVEWGGDRPRGDTRVLWSLSSCAPARGAWLLEACVRCVGRWRGGVSERGIIIKRTSKACAEAS